MEIYSARCACVNFYIELHTSVLSVNLFSLVLQCKASSPGATAWVLWGGPRASAPRHAGWPDPGGGPPLQGRATRPGRRCRLAWQQRRGGPLPPHPPLPPSSPPPPLLETPPDLPQPPAHLPPSFHWRVFGSASVGAFVATLWQLSRSRHLLRCQMHVSKDSRSHGPFPGAPLCCPFVADFRRAGQARGQRGLLDRQWAPSDWRQFGRREGSWGERMWAERATLTDGIGVEGAASTILDSLFPARFRGASGGLQGPVPCVRMPGRNRSWGWGFLGDTRGL